MFGFGNDKSKHIIPKAMRAEGGKEAETVNMILGGIGVVVAIGGGIISFVNGLRLADKVVNEWDKKQQAKK